MTDSYYVIFNRNGIDRWAKTDAFTLKAGEHALQVELEVPDEAFQKPPIPVTRIVVDANQIARNMTAVTEEVEP